MQGGKFLDSETKNALKIFLAQDNIKELISNNEYYKLFAEWASFVAKLDHTNLMLRAELAYLLTLSGVDFLSNMRTLPKYIFWYWPEKEIKIPSNIEEIEEYAFKLIPGSQIILNYDGTKKEFLAIKHVLKNLLLSNIYQPKSIIVKCSDGTIYNKDDSSTYV